MSPVNFRHFSECPLIDKEKGNKQQQFYTFNFELLPSVCGLLNATLWEQEVWRRYTCCWVQVYLCVHMCSSVCTIYCMCCTQCEPLHVSGVFLQTFSF